MARFELKYPIPFHQRSLTEDHLSFYRNEKSSHYQVRSLYFDQNLENFWDKIEGSPIRRKVRIRYYGSEELDKCKIRLEVKHRKWNHISKDQEWISPEIAQSLSLGESTHPWIGGFTPSLWVSYQREEFSFLDMRLTFDTGIEFHLPGSDIKHQSNFSILEVKTENYQSLRHLAWLTNLGAQSFSKYAEGIKQVKGIDL